MIKTETKDMADMDQSDGEQVVNFFNDGDSVDEFEDFRPEDLIDFNDGNNNILANLPISYFSPDREIVILLMTFTMDGHVVIWM